MEENRYLTDAEGATPLQLLTFRLGTPSARRATFGVNVGIIREVAKAPPITPIPGAAEHVAGMVSLRGNLIRVVDLSDVVLGAETPNDERFLIVTDVDDRQQAFLVSGIDAILRIQQKDIRKLESFTQVQSNLVQGVVMNPDESLVTMLDLSQIDFSEDPMAALTAATNILH